MEDQITGEKVIFCITPLRWFLKTHGQNLLCRRAGRYLENYQNPGEEMANSEAEQASP